MKDTKSSATDRTSVSSGNRLITYNNKKKTTDNRSVDRQPTSIEKTKTAFTLLPPQSSADKLPFRGPFGITKASSIVWYTCICILFIISFLSLVLSVLYFITDASTEQVIKLYGICGSSSVAISTFVIVFLDCCNDGSTQDYEDVTIYKIFQTKEARDKELANHRKADEKEGKPKPYSIQYQQPQKVSSELRSHAHPYHHFHAHPPTAYHHPFACPVCHDLHASGNSRHNLVDIAIDTSDGFEPVLNKGNTIHKSTRNAQTDSKLWDTERGTQTDRAEGTQTSSMELAGIPDNITEIIYETTVVKAPRSLMATLKKALAQQDKDMVGNEVEEGGTF